MPMNQLAACVKLVACVKLARAIWHVLVGFFTIVFIFPRLSQAQKELRIQIWSAKMLGCLQVALVVKGPSAVPGPMLLAANHISWLDIISMHAAKYCRFVSKADIKQWPVIGRLATGGGTLFIERASRRDAMRVVHHMTERLCAGDVIGVFPEGTTSDGQSLLPFHANLFQAAIAADAPVQPVALQFMDQASGQISLAPCYIGDDTLWRSLWRTVRTPGIAVVITFGEPQRAQGRDRRAWALALRSDIERLRQL